MIKPPSVSPCSMASPCAESVSAAYGCWAVAHAGANTIATRINPNRVICWDPKFMTLVDRADRTD